MTAADPADFHTRLRDSRSELETHVAKSIGGPEPIAEVAGQLAARMAHLVMVIDEHAWSPEMHGTINELDALVPEAFRAHTDEQLCLAVGMFRDRVRQFLVPI